MSHPNTADTGLRHCGSLSGNCLYYPQHSLQSLRRTRLRAFRLQQNRKRARHLGYRLLPLLLCHPVLEGLQYVARRRRLRGPNICKSFNDED